MRPTARQGCGCVSQVQSQQIDTTVAPDMLTRRMSEASLGFDDTSAA
jgi:hypothetical protein